MLVLKSLKNTILFRLRTCMVGTIPFYGNVVDGFAAKLTREEAEALEEKEEVVSARRTFSLHTTHTPRFLGLQQGLGLWKNSNFGKGIIIGVLDTGITPEHLSFNDEGIPFPPAKWNGHCEFTGEKTCNKSTISSLVQEVLSKTQIQPFHWMMLVMEPTQPAQSQVDLCRVLVSWQCQGYCSWHGT